MKALITGISGQDGSYMAEMLEAKGYDVYGLVRRVALQNPEHRLWRLQGSGATLIPGSLDNYGSVVQAVTGVAPDELYHLGAQSDVHLSFHDPFTTMEVNVAGTLHVLEAVRKFAPACKVYFAGSSEMFGKVTSSPQNERTPFHPRSPYGAAKVAGFHLTRNYREAYDMFACSGILFNHESPRRGAEFVTRKIARGAARIAAGLQDELRLGNMDAKRDWGHARDYVRAMWMMLQQDTPDDYVIGTGRTWSVGAFCTAAFGAVGLNWKDYVVTDPKFYRPAEVQLLHADATKAKAALGWEPEVSFEDLVGEMVAAEVRRASDA